MPSEHPVGDGAAAVGVDVGDAGDGVGSSRKRTRVCADIQRIRQMLADGVTLDKIARKYGIHRNTLSLYIRTTPPPVLE